MNFPNNSPNLPTACSGSKITGLQMGLSLISSEYRCWRGVGTHTSNPSTREAEAEGAQIGIQPKLRRPAWAVWFDTLSMRRQAIKVNLANVEELRFFQN